MRNPSLLLGLGLMGWSFLASTGCRKSSEGAQAPAQAPVSGEAPIFGKAKAGEAAPQGEVLRGRVLERLEAPPYSYLRLKVDGSGAVQDEVWAAVPQTTLNVGEEAVVLHAMPMEKWESKQLKRTFDRLYLGSLEGQDRGSAASASPHAASGMASPHGAPVPAKPVGDVRVPRAEGPEGRTIAECYAQKGALGGKPVLVRGKVVKLTQGLSVPGFKGGTWLHLQDGSGEAAKGDHDLTVTTDDAVAVGDVVLVKGSLKADPKIGSGYDRSLMVEAGKVKKER